MGRFLHEDINRVKCFVAAEYVLLVDFAVELQNNFHTISAKCTSPIFSPNRKILLSKPDIVMSFL